MANQKWVRDRQTDRSATLWRSSLHRSVDLEKENVTNVYYLKLVSETLNLNNLVRSAGKVKSNDTLNSARALDVKNVLTFIHIFQLRQWKWKNVGGNNILGHPVVYIRYTIYVSVQRLLRNKLKLYAFCSFLGSEVQGELWWSSIYY